MTLSTKARLISAVVVGVVGGAALRLNNLQQFHMSRDDFLAAQAARYDSLITAHPSAFAAFAKGVLMAVAAVGLYELLVFVIRKILAKTDDEPGGAEGT